MSFINRAIDYTPVDGTYYSSVLLRKYATTTRGDLLAGLGRLQDAETNIFSIDGTWIGFVDGGITFFWGPNAHPSTVLPKSLPVIDRNH